jgi:hypothetical protein
MADLSGELFGASDAKPSKNALADELFGTQKQAPSTMENIAQGVGNLVAGGVRGAGSIGASILYPIDKITDMVKGDRNAGLSSLVTGVKPLSRNEERRQQIDEGLRSMGAEPESMLYKGGKLAGEIAGTAGAGGAAANVLARTGAVSAPLLSAISSGGFSAGGLGGGAGLATRAAGGAISGGLSSGLVNPNDAATGALIGGALPPALMGLGKLGGAIGNKLGGNVLQPNPEKLRVAKESIDAGYVIPPSMVNPSFGNRTLETVSGKHSTAQIASTKNQAITEKLVRNDLGLDNSIPLSFETMKNYRSLQNAQGYEPLKSIGEIAPGNGFNSALDGIAKSYTGKGTIPAIEKKEVSALVNAHKSNSFDAGDAVDAIRILRDDAASAFQKGDNALGKANKAIANAYEDAIDTALAGSGQQELLGAYRNARQNIAKSFTVEKAIREGSGTLDARVLARELQKGAPLSGDIKKAAQFANVFDKAAQPPHLIGSPDVHNLRAGSAALMSGIGGATMGPVGIGLGALNYLAPPAARAMMFANKAQNKLVATPAAKGLLGNSLDEILQTGYKVAPGLLSRF